jgi:serine/threonine-protein kinase
MPSDTPTLPAEDAPLSYEEGQVLGGKYRLERLLAQGGMGSVWRATNTSLDVEVAVKVIAAADDRAWLRARFLQEAHAAARLRHPAIVRVFDVDQTPLGDPFIVMELLEGETLAKRLTPRLEPVEAVRFLLPIADALRVAHEGGVIHRDVKPENVFLATDGGGHLQPKLLDFGIVKLERAIGKERLTGRGEFVGTPEYMSPEQARGRDDLDETTDVWSLCVVLYEAVTGRLPFKMGENYRALLRSIVEDPPAPMLELEDDDRELAGIIERGLAKEPKARWLSMHELGTALAVWLLGRGVGEDAAGSSIEVRWLDRRKSMPSPQDVAPAASGSTSVVGVVAKLPASHDRSRLVLGGALVALAAALSLLWTFTRPRLQPEPVRAASAPTSAPALGPTAAEKPPTVVPIVAATSSAGIASSAPKPEHGVRVTRPSPAKPAKIANPPPRPSAKVDASLDLLDPY